MEKITAVGIDLAKIVSSVHGVDAHGKTVQRKTVAEAHCSNSSHSCRGA